MVASSPVAPPLRRTFRGEPGQVPVMRDFLRCYLTSHGCPASAAQDILVCATELATNAVLHSRSRLPDGRFSVEIAICTGQWVHVAVKDSGGPWMDRGTCETDEDAECGRGLHVVSALSQDMGITADARGRTAWFRSRWSACQQDDCLTRYDCYSSARAAALAS